jgi:hypothetical protein
LVDVAGRQSIVLLVHAADMPGADDLMMRVYAAMAQNEREPISERTKAARAPRATAEPAAGCLKWVSSMQGLARALIERTVLTRETWTHTTVGRLSGQTGTQTAQVADPFLLPA